jgi:DNA-directed RNA polymerase specialized sigma24 family protein
MSAEEERFDAFYRSTRGPIMHQTFALTGDLPAATRAVQESYVAAWQHWRKVSTLPDPEAWVRPRAWNTAQRRHTARIWHRSKGLAPEHKAVLDGIAKLPAADRRMLLLTQLAGLPLEDAAREARLTQPVAERSLRSGVTGLATQLGVDPAQVRGELLGLREAIHAAVLPRPSIVRRAGRKRRHSHAVVGVVGAVLVAVGAGALADEPDASRAEPVHLIEPAKPADPASVDARHPTADQLLDADQISRLGPGQHWKVTRTGNNTSGDGINTICQQSRFADPDGLSAIVRHFSAAGHPRRAAVQSVEISKSARQAEQAFHTTVGWYAGCQVGRLQLLKAYRVDGIGDQATVLLVRVWNKPVTTYSIAVARIGAVTTTTVGKTVGGPTSPGRGITQSLADSVSMLCGKSGSQGCSNIPTYTAAPPPPAGGERGVLAVADLPPVGTIDRAWVGTTPGPARANPAQTTCDQANFATSAARTRTRTYLIPQAKLPARFGLSETYGVFASRRAASRFLSQVRHKVHGCEHRDLATKVTHHRAGGSPKRPTEWETWDLATAVTKHDTVRFRLGFVRYGRTVAELSFAPAPHQDMSPAQFRALVHRAGDRLRELGAN